MNDIAADEIYVVPMGEQWLLVSPRSQVSATVNRPAVDAVASCAAGNGADAPLGVRDLWRQLSTTRLHASFPLASMEKLVIIPTRSCNMRCVYCDFGAPSTLATVLDPRLACRLIDAAVASMHPSSSTLRIHFFGGEPMVARSCTETVVHYARMVCSRMGLTPWFEITTNGLFDPSAVPFIGDYMDSAVVSLDGDRSEHDYNRRRADGTGTYADIAANLRRLGRHPVELSVRACITNRSVGLMTEMASHFCSEFAIDHLCFEMLAPNESARVAGLEPPDPCRFAAGVLEAEGQAARGVRIVHGPSELTASRPTSCPVGPGTLMLDPEGRLMACYLETERWTRHGLDPQYGHVDLLGGAVIEKGKIDAFAGILRSKPRCARCFCRHTCAGGCHAEQTFPGCSLAYDDRCRATRVITAGRLLRNLEGAGGAALFAGQPSVMLAVADNPDDRLTAWKARSTAEMP